MSTENQSSSCDNNNLRIHFFYVVLILSGALIITLTSDWTKLDGFTEYLSVAATITSLVLGVLAIIYSFVSNGSMSQFLGSIEASTSSIRNVSVELRAVADGARTIQERADERTTQLQKLAMDLRGAIEDINDRTSAIAGTVESLPSHLGELKEAIFSRRAEVATSGTELATFWTKELAEQALSTSSRLGLAALRALQQAYIVNKHCDLQAIFDTEESKDFEYVYGYVIAFISVGLIGVDEEKNNAFALSKARLKNPPEWLTLAINGIWDDRLTSDDESTVAFFKEYDVKIRTELKL